jgi:hypothetical protein
LTRLSHLSVRDTQQPVRPGEQRAEPATVDPPTAAHPFTNGIEEVG